MFIFYKQLVENGQQYVLSSTGMPSHEIDNSVNPNAASAQNFNYNISKAPMNEGIFIFLLAT